MKKVMTAVVLLILLVGSTFIYIPAPERERAPTNLREKNLIPDRDEGDISTGTRNENKLVARWHLDGDYEDSTGNGNGGTKHGDVHFVDGVNGKAASFDGENDYILVEDAPILDITDEITIEAWVKLNELNRKQCFVGKRHGTAASQIGYLLKMGDDNSLAMQFNGFGYNAGALVANMWQHVAGTYDGATIDLYINGEKTGSYNVSGSITSNNAPVYLGAFYYSSFTNQFNGKLDEIAIYNKVLAENEIKAQYRKTGNDKFIEEDEFGGSWFDDFDDDSGIEGGLGGSRLEADEHTVGLWHFDEGAGNQARDGSGNGNHGTLQSMEEGDWVDGKYGKGLEFGGGGEYVTVANEENFDFDHNDSFSIETWIKTNDDWDNYIIGRRDGAGTVWRGYCLAIFENGEITVHLMHNHLNNEKIWVNGNTNVADNKWHHIAFTYNGNGDASGVKIYVDGKLETMTVSHNNLGGKTILNDIPLKIGARGDGQAQSSFVGCIDDVHISNITRKPEEIQRNFESGLVIKNGKVELNNWQCNRTITIANNGNALVNYQVQVNLTPQSFNYSHAKNDGGDVRLRWHGQHLAGVWQSLLLYLLLF